MLDKNSDQNKMARQKVEVFLDVIKMAETALISCTSIISLNNASDFTGACSHFLSHITQLHGGAHMEAHR